MNRVIYFIQNTLLRQVFTVLLIGFAFLTMQIAGYNTIQPAFAETVTSPEGVYYKGVPDDDVHRNINKNNYGSDTQNYKTDSGNIIEGAKNKLQETAETVKEKLNLDEETPRATKEFLRSTESKVEKAVEPVTGTRSGYYQLP
jgi:hypothetical protein